MKILVDTHTHTDVSDHAYSTLYENMLIAKRKGLEMVVMTNHGTGCPDAPHKWHFDYLAQIPKVIEGVLFMGGIETSVLDADGNIDLMPCDVNRVDAVIASMHQSVLPPSTFENHTLTWLNTIKNPFVDILGHSGENEYAYDYEKVITFAKDHNKLIEINNNSISLKKGRIKTTRPSRKFAKKLGQASLLAVTLIFAIT